MTDLTVFRVYEPWECGLDGYPYVWHKGMAVDADGVLLGPNGEGGVKHLVREEAGHRCLRCRHPYVVGESGRWESVTQDPRDVPARQLVEQMEDGRTDANQQRDYRKDQAVLWSRCDAECAHGGPLRWLSFNKGWVHVGCGPPRDLGIPEIDVEAAWRILTVHHLNERKHDLRWWNLAALCQRCHLHIQKKVQMERVYPFEHTDWFKVYAAGWYAQAYLGETLTRAEAEARMDDLLALERMA